MEHRIGTTSGHRPDRTGDTGTGITGTAPAMSGRSTPSPVPDGAAAPSTSDRHRAPAGASASPPAEGAAPPGAEAIHTDRDAGERASVQRTGGDRVVGERAATHPATSRRAWRDQEVRLLAVAGRLTERDRLICRLLDEHRVLTTAQVADVGFTGERRARMRLAELHALEVIERFRPRTWGNPAPYHFTLGPLGAALVAAESGRQPAAASWRRTLAHDLAHSQRLAHLVGVNGLFCALLRSARTRGGCYLDEWWSERRCAREWGEVVRPDGYGIWTEHGTSLPFLLEYDNSTEPTARLAAKLDGYQRLAEAAGHPNWVLFSFASPRREHEARRVLAHPAVPVATAARAPGVAPDSAIWAPVTSDPAPRRVGLAALAAVAPGT